MRKNGDVLYTHRQEFVVVCEHYRGQTDERSGKREAEAWERTEVQLGLHSWVLSLLLQKHTSKPHSFCWHLVFQSTLLLC